MNRFFGKIVKLYKWANNYFVTEAHFGCAVTATFAERWSKRLQVLRDPTAIYAAIANWEERANLRNGDVVHRPYMTSLYAKTLPTTGAFARQTLTITDSSLTVNVMKEVSYFVVEYEEIQASIKFTNDFATHVGKLLINSVDGDVLGEYDQATSYVGNYELSGSGSAGDGVGFTLTTSNILKTFALANRKLDRLNISMSNRWGVISGEFRDILFQYIAGKESALGDTTGKNGHIGKYAGFNLYVSNSLGFSAYLDCTSTDLSDGESLTINGVTLTARSASPSAEGDFVRGVDLTTTLSNLAYMINNPGTTGTTSGSETYALSASDQKLFAGITASPTALVLYLKVEGKGYVALTEGLTAASWVANKTIQHNLFGQGRPIDLVIQKYPKMVTQVRSDYVGRDFISWELYGLKTFAEGTDQLVDVQSRADSF